MGQASRGKGREEGREGRMAEYHAQCHACSDANSSPFHQITKSPGMYIRTYVRTCRKNQVNYIRISDALATYVHTQHQYTYTVE